MDYVRHLVKRYKLEPVIQFKSQVTGATWDDAAKKWTINVERTLDDGSKETENWTGQFLILATGCLSAPNLPKFEGQDEYNGALYHTSRWPKEGVDFSGKTVAVIGTGSSAVQTIPVVAETCQYLTVFQRTPTYTIPAWNRQLTAEELEAAKLDSQELRKIGLTHPLGNATFAFTEKTFKDFTPEEREARLEHIWDLGGLNFYSCFADVLVDPESSGFARLAFHFDFPTFSLIPARPRLPGISSTARSTTSSKIPKLPNCSSRRTHLGASVSAQTQTTTRPTTSRMFTWFRSRTMRSRSLAARTARSFSRTGTPMGHLTSSFPRPV